MDWKERVANYVEKHGPALFSAILILAAGFFVARWAGKLAMHWLSRKELQLEPPVRMLMVRLLRLLVRALALATVREILSRNPRVLKEPAPAVGVTALGDSSVNIAVKPWVAVGDFGPAGAEINQAILEEFRLRRIDIPFPQREIRLLNAETG